MTGKNNDKNGMLHRILTITNRLKFFSTREKTNTLTADSLNQETIDQILDNRQVRTILLIISVPLLIGAVSLLMAAKWNDKDSDILCDPGNPVISYQAPGYIDTWVGSENAEPVHQSLETIQENSSSRRVYSFKRRPGEGYAGCNIYLHKTVLSENAFQFIMLNQGQPVNLQISLKLNAEAPQSWFHVVEIQPGNWNIYTIPFSSFQLMKQSESDNPQINRKPVEYSIELISFVFIPGEEIDLLLGPVSVTQKHFAKSAFTLSLLSCLLMFLYTYRLFGKRFHRLPMIDLSFFLKHPILLLAILIETSTMFLPIRRAGASYEIYIILTIILLFELLLEFKQSRAFKQYLTYLSPWTTYGVLYSFYYTWSLSPIIFISTCLFLIARKKVLGFTLCMIYLVIFVLLHQKAPQWGVDFVGIFTGVCLLLIYLLIFVYQKQKAFEYVLSIVDYQKSIIEEKCDMLEKSQDQLQELLSQFKIMAQKDGLTQLANRRVFDEKFEEEWRRGIRYKHPLSVALCDIDHFKKYNDSYGHLEGDQCIKAIASVLDGAVSRAGDLVARYGGEEFVFVMPNTPSEKAGRIMESVRVNVENLKISHKSSECAEIVTLSIGVATVVPNNNMTPGQLLVSADQTLYEAKNSGRNQIKKTDIDLSGRGG